jgi:hypothetical protein
VVLQYTAAARDRVPQGPDGSALGAERLRVSGSLLVDLVEALVSALNISTTAIGDANVPNVSL